MTKNDDIDPDQLMPFYGLKQNWINARWMMFKLALKRTTRKWEPETTDGPQLGTLARFLNQKSPITKNQGVKDEKRRTTP